MSKKFSDNNPVPAPAADAKPNPERSGSGSALLTFSGKDGVTKNVPLRYFPKTIAYHSAGKKR